MKKKLKHKKSRTTIACRAPSPLDTMLLISISLIIFSTIINASLWIRGEIVNQKYREIKSEVTRWEILVNQTPTYRDGYLKLAILYWQLREDDKARAALQTAKTIDPNFEGTQELKQELKY